MGQARKEAQQARECREVARLRTVARIARASAIGAIRLGEACTDLERHTRRDVVVHIRECRVVVHLLVREVGGVREERVRQVEERLIGEDHRGGRVDETIVHLLQRAGVLEVEPPDPAQCADARVRKPQLLIERAQFPELLLEREHHQVHAAITDDIVTLVVVERTDRSERHVFGYAPVGPQRGLIVPLVGTRRVRGKPVGGTCASLGANG